jgi:hypothetical protein
MGKLVLTIPDELEQKFRDAVYKRYGMKKGNITKAVIEALKMWIAAINEKVERSGDRKGSADVNEAFVTSEHNRLLRG